VVSDGGTAIENVSHDTGVVYQDGDYLKADLDTNPPPTKNGTWKGNCGAYVQALVPNINNTSRGSAANWIEDYNLQPFSSDNDLRTHLEPGDVVVWPATGEDNKGHQGANNVHGHAAVIIEVHEDHVVLAESSWDYDNIPQSPRIGRILNRVKLNDGLYVWSNPEINQNQTEVLYG